MRIAAKLNGWLLGAPFFLMVGVIFGMIILRAGLLVSLVLFAGVLLTALIWFYPVVGILGIIAGTCFIPFDAQLGNIGSIHVPDLILYLVFFGYFDFF
jgi:hypothetical protein